MEEKRCPHCGQKIIYDYGDLTPMAKYLIELIATGEKVSVTQIRSSNRTDDVAVARHIYLFIMRELYPRTPLALIGATVNRHHTSVVHARKNIKKYIEVNKAIEKRVRTYWELAKSFASLVHPLDSSPAPTDRK